MRQQIKQLLRLKEKVPDSLDPDSPDDKDLLSNVTELLKKLVVGTFIVETQPPQVS